jgi:hypothetical protein
MLETEQGFTALTVGRYFALKAILTLLASNFDEPFKLILFLM